MLEVNCKSWDDFKIIYSKNLSLGGLPFDKNNFLFRGQMDFKWKIQSSFDRIEIDKSKYGTLIKRFKDTLIKHHHPILEIHNVNDEIISAFGQHHGLPTRLIDWSSSPYIAAFFAFSDVILNGYNGKMTTIWAINKNSEALKRESGGLKFLEIPNDKFNSRLRNQLGQFTLSQYTQDTLEDFVDVIAKKHNIYDTLWRFNIPTSSTRLALEDLELMNITYNSIYPDVQGFTRDSVFKVLR